MLSREYLINRGTCCGLGCLMCPYEPKHTEGVTEVMKKIINCFKEDNPLIQKKLREVSVEEGYKIATELFQILNKRGDGIGLAANQVGIDAQVAVVNVKEPIVLINPEIVSKEEEVRYYEGCLSFPKKGCHTKRYKTIEVKVDNIESNMTFGAGDTDTDLLESVCVQHEIDHLNGMRILDRAQQLTIRREKPKIGRNEPCHCGSGKKYKKCCIN
jgi:peptide deformylase|tara:strand:- start:103 stop:744 length:642 start_codon:yes stop_codon:yes gene_type:complete